MLTYRAHGRPKGGGNERACRGGFGFLGARASRPQSRAGALALSYWLAGAVSDFRGGRRPSRPPAAEATVRATAGRGGASRPWSEGGSAPPSCARSALGFRSPKPVLGQTRHARDGSRESAAGFRAPAPQSGAGGSLTGKGTSGFSSTRRRQARCPASSARAMTSASSTFRTRESRMTHAPPTMTSVTSAGCP